MISVILICFGFTGIFVAKKCFVNCFNCVKSYKDLEIKIRKNDDFLENKFTKCYDKLDIIDSIPNILKLDKSTSTDINIEDKSVQSYINIEDKSVQCADNEEQDLINFNDQFQIVYSENGNIWFIDNEKE
tara:strand:- start:105 stop:494 length:390 start_codon:yes stop_codon:yes gene_type:complete